ncbi:ABC transporter substrate-binding protein [Microbacterium sp. A196]|uniref:ABC transporter substrate-binding protein n=1 Tax=Microbacterium sp. A196 TaxID=3457320 RepID=UPI003FD66C54
MISRKPAIRVLAIAAVGVVGLGLAACAPTSSGGGGGGGEGAEETTVTVWSWRTEDVKQYEEIFDVYEEANPGVTVDFKPFKNTEYNQILTTGLAGSDGPDVVQLKSYGGVQALIDSGSIIEIGSSVPALEEFPPATTAALSDINTGDIYGVPFAVNTFQVFYNTAIFEEHGIEEPTTWDEFLEISQTLKDAGVIPITMGGADAQVQIPVSTESLVAGRYGGAEFAEAVRSGEKDFTDPDYVASLELMDELKPFFPENVTATSADDAMVLFLSGQAAMYPSGSFQAGTFTSQAPDLDFDAFAMPVGDDWVSKEPITPGFVDGGYGVSARSENQDAAIDLVAWMATEEFGQMFSDLLSQNSPVPGVTNADPILQEQYSNYEANGAPYLLLTDFRYGQPWGTDLLGTAVQRIWLGEQTAEEAAADIQAGISQWYTPKK